MPRYFAVLSVGLLATAATVAAVGYGAPHVVGERPPAGLLGMIGGLGVALSLVRARRELPPAGKGR